MRGNEEARCLLRGLATLLALSTLAVVGTDAQGDPPAPPDPEDLWFDVTQYGADPLPLNDDTAAIQSAFAAAAGGKTVYFPPGEYEIRGTVTMNTVSIRGAGLSPADSTPSPPRSRIVIGAASISAYGPTELRPHDPDMGEAYIPGFPLENGGPDTGFPTAPFMYTPPAPDPDSCSETVTPWEIDFSDIPNVPVAIRMLGNCTIRDVAFGTTFTGTAAESLYLLDNRNVEISKRGSELDPILVGQGGGGSVEARGVVVRGPIGSFYRNSNVGVRSTFTGCDIEVLRRGFELHESRGEFSISDSVIRQHPNGSALSDTAGVAFDLSFNHDQYEFPATCPPSDLPPGIDGTYIRGLAVTGFTAGILVTGGEYDQFTQTGRWTGTGSANRPARCGVRILGCDIASVTGLEVVGPAFSDFTLTDCRLDTVGRGVSVVWPGDPDPLFEFQTLPDADSIVISGNTIESGLAGVWIEGYSSNVSISSNVFRPQGDLSEPHIRVAGNRESTNPRMDTNASHVFIEGGVVTERFSLHSTVIQGNLLPDQSLPGTTGSVHIHECENVTISGNVISGSDSLGNAVVIDDEDAASGRVWNRVSITGNTLGGGISTDPASGREFVGGSDSNVTM